jgi:hypothetical protein
MQDDKQRGVALPPPLVSIVGVAPAALASHLRVQPIHNIFCKGTAATTAHVGGSSGQGAAQIFLAVALGFPLRCQIGAFFTINFLSIIDASKDQRYNFPRFKFLLTV